MKALSLISVACLLTCSFYTSAQKCLTANGVADSVQDLRNDARSFYDKEKATKQDIDKGIAILNKAIRFLDSLPIIKLGESNYYLKRRKADASRELVYAYALNHKNKEAIETLKLHFNEGTSFAILDMVEDTVFRELQHDPAFTGLVSKYKERIALWRGDAFTTPSPSELSDTEKIAGLSLLWAQARSVFPYFDHLPNDWNKTYMSFIPKVQATKNTIEYYKVLQMFYAELHDGHSNVYFPKELSMQVNARPPLRTELIEGRVFITTVNNDSLKKTGIIPGLEVIKIDGRPVREYAEATIAPYLSSSTKQDLDVRVYTYSLLAGDSRKPVVLEVKDRKGNISSRSIPRSGYPKTKPAPSLEYREIDHIGYLKIYNFEDHSINKQFDSLFTTIKQAKALIIDIRNNGGGDSGIGNRILSSFTDKPFQLFASKHVQTDALINASNLGEPLWANEGTYMQGPNRKQFYDKPIVLLINAATFSAAEDFAIAFDAMHRGKLIGQPTGGSTGQPIRFDLPGGGSARVCGRRETYPDGKEFVGIGIQPHILVEKTVQDLFSGTDSVLKKALDVLK